MAEYVDRRKIYEEACDGCWYHGDEPGMCLSVEPCERLVVAFAPAQAADVAPVAHGYWVYKHRHRGGVHIYEGKDEMGETRRISVDERYEIDDPYCSECWKLNESVWLSYCPNCGVKMDV